jgi:transposase
MRLGGGGGPAEPPRLLDPRCASGRTRESAKIERMAGRPTLLTPERADDLVLLLAAGASTARAAAAVGVGERSVRRWLHEGGLRERVRQARASTPDPADSLSEARLVLLIARAAAHDWRAGAWMLERRWPERWGNASMPM